MVILLWHPTQTKKKVNRNNYSCQLQFYQRLEKRTYWGMKWSKLCYVRENVIMSPTLMHNHNTLIKKRNFCFQWHI